MRGRRGSGELVTDKGEGQEAERERWKDKVKG